MLFAALAVAASCFWCFNLLQHVFTCAAADLLCAGDILHEADRGIRAYAVKVFIAQRAARCGFFYWSIFRLTS